MINNRKQFGIFFLITSLLFDNLVACIMANIIPIPLKNIGIAIEKKPKVLWLLAASTLCITSLFLIKDKNNIFNKVNNNIKNSSNLKQNVSFVNGVAIVDYNINNYQKEVQKIAEQDPDKLDDTKGASKNQKIAAIMNDLQNVGTTKILINEGNVPIGFIQYRLLCMSLGHILLLAIDNQHLRRGYGTLLLKYAINALQDQKATSIIIDMRKENEPAKKACEKLNFVFHEANPGYHEANRIREGVIQGTLECIGT